jgi:uncharacterized membrane protein
MGDLLFEFTEWLRSTQLTELSLAIGETPFSLWLQTNFWAIPIIQVIHILSIAAGFGSVLMVTLRLFERAGTDRTIAETERRYVRWIWGALVFLVLSGLLLIIAEPIRELINPIFWIKVGLIVTVIVVSLAFHGRVMRRLATGGTVTGGIKFASVLIIILWCATMLAGRWIAYAPV